MHGKRARGTGSPGLIYWLGSSESGKRAKEREREKQIKSAMVVEWLCPGLRPTGNRRPRQLHCKVILLDEHELMQDVLVSNQHFDSFSIDPLFFFYSHRDHRVYRNE